MLVGRRLDCWCFLLSSFLFPLSSFLFSSFSFLIDGNLATLQRTVHGTIAEVVGRSRED
jgi:hypothetical protein